jgi:hypothetical protein
MDTGLFRLSGFTWNSSHYQRRLDAGTMVFMVFMVYLFYSEKEKELRGSN